MENLMKLQELNEQFRKLLEMYESARMRGDDETIKLIKNCLGANAELMCIKLQELE